MPHALCREIGYQAPLERLARRQEEVVEVHAQCGR